MIEIILIRVIIGKKVVNIILKSKMDKLFWVRPNFYIYIYQFFKSSIILNIKFIILFKFKILLLLSSSLLFGGGWVLNPKLCIYYALFLPTELSSRGQILNII